MSDYPGFAPGTAPPGLDDALLVACADLIKRSGAQQFRIGWTSVEPSDPDAPPIWYTTALYAQGRQEASGAMDPVTAALRLTEQLVDGANCTHCKKPTILQLGELNLLPTDFACAYTFDRPNKTFKRSCE